MRGRGRERKTHAPDHVGGIDVLHSGLKTVLLEVVDDALLHELLTCHVMWSDVRLCDFVLCDAI